MAKDQLVSDAVAAVSAALGESLDKFYEAAFAEGVASVPVPSGGGFSQADLDAAVQAARDADAQALAQVQASDAQALSDAQAQAAQAAADAKAQYDALAAKEGVEASALADLKSSADRLQQIVDLLKGLGSPVPAPDAPSA